MHRTRTVALLLAITACEGTPNESRLSHRSNPLYGEFSQLFDLVTVHRDQHRR